MRRSRYALQTAVSVAAIATVFTAAPALAQNAAAPATASAADQAGDQLPDQPAEIIVTGTTGGGVSRQNAAFAQTTIKAEDITKLAPASTAELLRLVPGISTETSGGQNGANIFVRGYPSGGDAEYVTLQTEGVPFFPPSTLSFLENSQLIRVDETLQRVEAVRGGTGALFSSGQPGLTVNFVQKEGGQNFEGLGKLSATTFGEVRADGYVSGPLGEHTTFLAGGYYASSHGVRDPQFQAEKGGQFTANIRHEFDRGSLLVFGRYLNDHGQWLTSIPVVQNGDKISAFPGFDAGTGTLAGNETRLSVLNDGTRVDLADGRGSKVTNFGANFNYDLTDNLKVRYRTSWLKGDADTTGLVPTGPAPQTAASFAADLGGTINSLTYVNGGAAVDPNTQVIETGTWIVRKQIESFVNDLNFAFNTGNNTLTVGGYYASYSSNDQWNLGNGRLVTATPNARVLNLSIINSTSGATQQVTRNGFAQGSFFNVNAAYDGRDYAFYATDEFEITPKLKVDGGIRWQGHEVDGTLENNGTTGANGTDGNANTLYDNNSAVLDGTFRTIHYYGDKVSWTVGGNYAFTPKLGLFLRYSKGHSFPFFDNLRDGNNLTQAVDTYEGGLKYSSRLLRAYLTVFHNDFSGLTTTVITNGAPIASVGGARTTGVELEGNLHPVQSVNIAFSGTFLDAKYQDFFTDGGATDLSGNTVQRQPKWQWRVSPSYDASFGNGNKATLYTSISYIGDRFSDVQNGQLLPNYYKWDAGVLVNVGKRIQFQIAADNLTNTIGLTEGNPRTLGSQGTGAILARPILGRSAKFSIGYKF
ncbi:MAG: TonB-dependent receptor [Sphingomonas sp.]|jgi:outer membrane receptor protein involved in Fe transport